MRRTILLVDDDVELRGFLKKLLSANNFKVIEAGDGAAALEIVEKTPPDVVVLDFGLPKVSGETVCADIKKNHPEIVVIALTAKATSEDIVHGLQIGADDYMAKPFEEDELMARIRARLTPDVKKISKPDQRQPLVKTVMHGQTGKMTFRESLVLVAVRLVGLELLFVVLFFLIVMSANYLGDYFHIADLFSTYVSTFLLLVILNVTMAIFIVLKWQSEYIEVTKGGIMKYSGIFYKKVDKYACSFVEIVTVEQSFLGMIFNYGTLKLYDPSLKDKIYISNIADPKKHSKIIESALSNTTDRTMPFIA